MKVPFSSKIFYKDDMNTRRQFVQMSVVAAAAHALAPCLRAQTTPFRGVIIGHTGRGDYGHGLDVAFTGVPGIEVLAVADPVESGRIKAADRVKAKRHYANWREMIEKEKPNLVCLASRWSEHRHEMAMAALQAGAHIYSEKPFTRTLAEGDEILALARQKNLNIAVAHQIRLNPATLKLKEALDGGMIGELMQIQSWGKQDARAGGEDMIVLGSHLFDLIRFFAGDPEWCTARVRENGKDITRQSGRTVGEQIGPVAGNDIFAQFAFPKGINATFTSNNKLRETFGAWSFRLVGTKGVIHFLVEIDPSIYLLKSGAWSPEGRADQWVRWSEDPNRSLPDDRRSFPLANRRLVDDLLASVRENRQPVCSAENANRSLEMIMAVYESAIKRERVTFPLKERNHPLA